MILTHKHRTNDMKTAIQQAIERLNEQIETLTGVQEDAEHAPAVIRFLKQERTFLNTLLPVEREQIEQAYGDGLNYHRFNCNRHEYFNQTYNDQI